MAGLHHAKRGGLVLGSLCVEVRAEERCGGHYTGSPALGGGLMG